MATRGGYEQVRPDWFNTANYAGFDWIAGQPHQELKQLWSRALRLRQVLPNLPLEIQAECIDKLVINPLDDCGYGTLNFISHKEIIWNKDSSPEQTHPYGQPTVSPTRLGQLPKNWAIIRNENPSTSLDDLYSSDSSHPHPYAFLSINLAASDSLIKKDFNTWLSKFRNHSTWHRPFTETPEALIEKWAGYKLIQCLDLIKIIGPAKGDRISKSRAIIWAQVCPERICETFSSRTLPNAMRRALHPSTIDYLI